MPPTARRRILITGASGLIGTNLALRLLDEGHEVVGVDQVANPWTDRVPVAVQDLRELTPAAARAWGRVDVVVHLAARAKVHESVEHPGNALSNYSITFNVLEYCRETDTPVIFASSREAYGEQAAIPVSEDRARISGAASPYAAAKLGEEALIQAYGRCYDLPFIVFRFSNVYGRYDDYRRNGRFIPMVLQRIRSGEPITIFGAHKQYDFTYIDDAVDGVARGVALLAGRRAPRAAHTINLGTGVGSSLVEAATVAGEVVGVPARIEIGAMRVGEISRYVADLTAARTVLGFEPAFSLRRGIAAYHAWWAAQPENAAAALVGAGARPTTRVGSTASTGLLG
jgi:nucleoside-diphosphate-sugar epimerase